MKTLIIGMGEVGTAHYNILSTKYRVAGFDIKTGWKFNVNYSEDARKEVSEGTFEIMHVATPWLDGSFVPMVEGYAKKHRPEVISVLTTVLPGTCAEIEKRTGIPTVHSTTRGLHPNLEAGLRAIIKHVAGSAADEVSEYFDVAGIKCNRHDTAATTEVAHLLINIDYAVALAFADEKARICREFGVDYFEAVMGYTVTYNNGFTKLDHKSKRRPVLTPPNGKIGGHCLVQNAQMLAPVLRAAGVKAPLVEIVERYNEK